MAGHLAMAAVAAAPTPKCKRKPSHQRRRSGEEEHAEDAQTPLGPRCPTVEHTPSDYSVHSSSGGTLHVPSTRAIGRPASPE